MKDERMYLTKKSHGVYYYRRPIAAEDQQFWRGPSGSPKREWNKSLRTKDRREAILRMTEAADLYELERARQYSRHAQSALTPAAPETDREREQREAREAVEAARQERFASRGPLRVLWLQRKEMSTAELTPEEAAARDLLRQRDADEAELLEKVAYMERRIAELGGTPVTAPRAQSQGAPEGPTIDALIDAYEADKAPGWSQSSVKAVKPVFRLLRDVFPGRAIAAISRQDARGVVGLLERLPTQIGKRRELAGLAVPEAVERGGKLGLPTISPKTINDGYILHIASLFNWAVREQWLPSNPFSGLSVHDPVDDTERRDAFTPEQLSELFTTTPWTAPWQLGDEKPGAYWVPLLCLFHGLRNGEASGLRVEDVYEVEGVPVIHIREYEGRTIKTAEARAVLPLHPELLRLGFMRFAEELRKSGAVALFLDGRANSRGQHGAKLAERFSSHVKGLRFRGRKLSMHSFRHNFEDRLRVAELPERTALMLSRRAEGGSQRVYGGDAFIKLKADAISKVRYPELDLSHLRPS